jgi:hypothetical protein
MSSILPELQTKLERLSPQQQAAVANFLEAFLEQEQPKPRAKMKLDWAGGLKDLRDRYTSVELQHEANKWREENALAYLNDEEK